MQQTTINTLYTRIKNVTEATHEGLGFLAPLTLLWKLSESKNLPQTTGINVYSFVEPQTEPEAGAGASKLYRLRGNVCQELMFPKDDSYFHDSVKFCSGLQDRWRKSRDVNISYYDPIVMPMQAQPQQSFLLWRLKVNYDVFETI